MDLSVIIPAYNEEKRLPETLKKVREYLSNKDYTWEVLIVNDGSKDQTAKVVSDLIKDWQVSNGSFRLIDNFENKGKGGVVKQGILAGKGDWRLIMDADNSTDISELEKLFDFANPKSEILNSKQILNSNDPNSKSENSESHISHITSPMYDIIIGSRYLNKDSIKVKQPLSRRIVSRLGNLLIRIMLGIKSVDTQCGFKLFSKKFSEEVFPLQTINRWGFDVEILAIAIKKGYKIKEVPIDWYDAEGSQVKKSAALKTLKELYIIKKNVMKGLYK